VGLDHKSVDAGLEALKGTEKDANPSANTDSTLGKNSARTDLGGA
jgi:hypothetical protein